MVPVGAREHVPALQLLRLEAGRHIVLDNGLYARLDIVQTFLEIKVDFILQDSVPMIN